MSGCQPTDTENKYIRKAIKEALDMCEEYKKKNPTNILNDIIEDKYSTSMVKKIQELEEKINKIGDTLHHFERRIFTLESSKLTQELDPHVWVIVNKRLDKLEDMSEHKKIEACLFEGAQMHASILRCEAKIKELEQSILETRIQFIEQLGNDKKPHKCPVCEGTRYGKPEKCESICSMSVDGIKIKDGESILFKPSCLSCQGSGVVWG